MENASKALLISGGVLIAILIMSISVYLFANYSDLEPSYNQRTQAIEIQKFNQNFTKFEGRENITIQEIVTIVNFAKQYEEETETHIEVYLSSDELKDNNIVDLIKNHSTITDGDIEKIKYFKCDRIEYEFRKANKIIFQNS